MDFYRLPLIQSRHVPELLFMAVVGVVLSAMMAVVLWLCVTAAYRAMVPPHVIARRELGDVREVGRDRHYVAIRTERGTLILSGVRFVPRGRAALEYLSDASIHVVIDGQRFNYRKGLPLWPWDHTPPADFDRVTR